MQHPEDAYAEDVLKSGLVFKKLAGQYWITQGERSLCCAVSNRLRKELIYPTADPTSRRARVVSVADIRAVDPVAVGDRVRFIDAGDGTGLITEVLPRRNKLVRRAAGTKPLEQVIVANVDQVVAIIAAARPAPKWELMDRYLAAATMLELPAVICINKIDLAEEDDLAEETATYRRIGYPVLLTSAVTGAGMARLREALAERVSVLVGPSGVGKTSLLNTLQPGLGRRVKEVSHHSDKGRHTTTHLEMFALDWGGSLIDTPGMREFGLWDMQDLDLTSSFPDLRPYLGCCRFGLDCTHSHEPGCAIKDAVAAGQVTERRYRSYLRMVGS